MSRALVVAAQQAVQKSDSLYLLTDAWLEWLDLRVGNGNISRETRVGYENGWRRFLDYAETQVKMDKVINARLIEAWLGSLRTDDGKPMKQNAVRSFYAGVRSFFAWAEGEHRIPYNPTSGVNAPKRRGKREAHDRDALSDGEVLKVLAQPDDSDAGCRDKAYLFLRAYTACRDVELHRADVGDLQTHKGRFALRIQGKGRREKDEWLVILPIAEGPVRDYLAVRHHVLAEAKLPQDGPLFISFSRRSRGQRLSLVAIRHMVKHYFLSAGITEEKKSSHSLRHSAVSTALSHGATVLVARNLARHASVDTTMIYVHEDDRFSHPPEEFIRYEDDPSDSSL